MPELSANTELTKIPEKPEAKDKLSDEQVGNMLAGVCNNPGKIITLFVMRNGDTFDSRGLYDGILRSQGETITWKMNNSVPFGYCYKSLEPIGLVAKETIDELSRTWGYAITEFGKEFGIPFGGKLLEFSERHNIPLVKLFGSTHSPSPTQDIQEEGLEDIEFKKRAPITTLKMLFEILTSPSLPKRVIDIERAIGEDNIFEHLNRLSEIGLIQFEAIKSNTRFALYKLSTYIPEGNIPVYQGQKALTNLVFATVNKNPDKYFTNEDIYNLLPQVRKDSYRDKQVLFVTISGILSHLVKNNYLQIEKFHSKKKSEIDITQDQRMILSELLEIIDKLQNKDPQTLREGRAFAERFIIDPERVLSALKRAKEASSAANQSPIEETQKEILTLIVSNPQGLTNKQIQELFEEKFSKRLGRHHIAEITSSLEEKNLKVEKKGKVKTFFPKTNPQAG